MLVAAAICLIVISLPFVAGDLAVVHDELLLGMLCLKREGTRGSTVSLRQSLTCPMVISSCCTCHGLGGGLCAERGRESGGGRPRAVGMGMEMGARGRRGRRGGGRGG